MLGKFILALFILAALPGEIASPRVYDDWDDTTSMYGSYELSHDTTYGLHYAEVFGITDTYDYVMYTAPYTRSVLLMIEASDNCIAFVDVFVSGVSMATPLFSYASTDALSYSLTAFVYQGQAVYYRIRCNGNCWWEVTLMTIPATCPATYVSYNQMYGYDLPYYGIPSIYYAYDPNCHVLVEGQNFTYADILDDAIEIWESCGNIDFVYSESNAYFTVTVDSSIVDIEVVHSQRTFGYDSWDCTEFNITDNMWIYNSMIDGEVNWLGQQPNIRSAVLGLAVIGFGLTLGICLNSTNSNGNSMMRAPFSYYDYLSDGDIRSLIMLWGDANNSAT